MKMRNLPRQIVPSGNFAVEGTKRETLEAYLGSCVGVTLCDRSRQVGGLIHLLLPEPAGVGSVWQPESYASTGLPLFIRTLCEAGASVENLTASIAGGALVGPTSRDEMNLDLGGRTVEIVEGILRQRGIPVEMSETGGYFTCRLSLNLINWESEIHPVICGSPPGKFAFKRPTPEELDAAIENVHPIPQVALKIIRMFQVQLHNISDVAQEIRQDQIISAKVIRLCNSAMFGLRKNIQSIDRAAVLLGERQLLKLVLSASLENSFPKNGQGYSLCKGGLFKHALGTAKVSEVLARHTGKVPPDLAYTAGLLHDIGKVVLDQYIAPISPLFYRKMQSGISDSVDAENSIFDTDHTDVGARLGSAWSLPDDLIDTISHHHHPERSGTDIPLTHLVYVADLIMSRFLVGQEMDRLNTDALAECMGRLGLSIPRLPEVVSLIPNEVFRASFDG